MKIKDRIEERKRKYLWKPYISAKGHKIWIKRDNYRMGMFNFISFLPNIICKLNEISNQKKEMFHEFWQRDQCVRIVNRFMKLKCYCIKDFQF